MKIMAPAGNFSSFLAGLKAGADSFYLGLSTFNARVNAENFDIETLKQVSLLGGIFNKEVFITINTLLNDKDFPVVEKILDEINSLNITGVIIQDSGLIEILKKYPKLKIVASTQFSVHSINGVDFSENVGFDTVVLARELSVEEILEIRKKSKIDIEIFGHGAMCYSYSGQCLFSSMIGGRSGNKGSCAQICRKRFDLGDGAKTLMSCNDLESSNYVNRLSCDGVNYLKIEGRMRSPQYVYSAVSYYKSLLNNENYDTDEILISFNRGYSNGYLDNRFNLNLTNENHVDNIGLYIGKVIEITDSVKILKCSNRTPQLDDGITIHNGRNRYGFVLKEDWIKTDNFLFYNENIKQFRVGDKVYITSSSIIKRKLEEKLFLKAECFLETNELVILIDDKKLTIPSQYSDNKNAFDKIQNKMNNYTYSEIMLKIDFKGNFENLFVPWSLIREKLNSYFDSYIFRENEKIKNNESVLNFVKKPHCGIPVFIVDDVKKKQLCNGQIVFSDLLFSFENNNEKIDYKNMIDFRNEIRNKNKKITDNVIIPPFVKDENYDLINKIKGRKIVSNPAEISILDENELNFLNFNFNITNSRAIEFYCSKTKAIPVLSLETDFKAIEKLESFNSAVYCFGYFPVMNTENCLVRKHKSCGDCLEYHSLVDEKDYEFQLKTNLFCQNIILFNNPINLSDKLGYLKKRKVNYFLVDLRNMDYSDAEDVFNFYTGKSNAINFRKFHGQYKF
ncbi:MAG: U32 family peptidase [Candidatus Delongbacteria bacterium]|nr:U32 family peptidase [Candidatus Delongbacteria bacterium]MBN2836789.1 U32 family peptidase [Candidatus Delongbacteria bacterium]